MWELFINTAVLVIFNLDYLKFGNYGVRSVLCANTGI